MRWPGQRLSVAGALLGALAFAIWEAATATVRDVIVETAYAYPYWIRGSRTVRYRFSCRSWPTEAVARQTMEEYAAVFHRIDSLGRSPSYVTVTLNTRNCPGKAALAKRPLTSFRLNAATMRPRRAFWRWSAATRV